MTAGGERPGPLAWAVALAAAAALHVAVLAGLPEWRAQSGGASSEAGRGRGLRVALGGPRAAAGSALQAGRAEPAIVSPPRVRPPVRAPAPSIAALEDTTSRSPELDSTGPLPAVAAGPFGDGSQSEGSGASASLGDGAELGQGLGSGSGDPGRSYVHEVAAQVQGCLRYPRRAMRRRPRGSATAELQVHIASDGRLLDTTLERTTGTRVLDRDALATVRRCGPYSPPPNTVEGSTTAFSIEVGYDLETFQ